MKKEFGKLTLEQFRQLLALLPKLAEQRQEFSGVFAEMSDDRFRELMVRDYSWGHVYEHSFVEHIALSFAAFNRIDWLHAIADDPDPQQRLLDEAASDVPADDVGLPAGIERHHVIGLVYSLQRSLLSILTYGQSISALVQGVRERGDMRALFNAVRMDRTVMQCPTVADRIARAELKGDVGFFRELRRALDGPGDKQQKGLEGMRFAMVVLRELGFDHLSDKELEALLVDDLGVYSQSPSSGRNLRVHYARARSKSST